jgi:hypothetical protein
LPLSELPEVMLIQALLLAADQEQPLGAVTLTVELPPLGTKVLLLGEMS